MKLVKIAELLYADIHNQLADSIDLVEKFYSEAYEDQKILDKETRNSIGFELMVFFLNFCFRQSDNFFKPEKGLSYAEKMIEFRDELKKIFIHHMLRSTLDLPANELIEFNQFLNELYDERFLEYNKYKKGFPTEDESLKGTLFWEFGNHIAEAANRPNDPALIIAANESAKKVLLGIDWKKVFSEDNFG